MIEPIFDQEKFTIILPVEKDRTSFNKIKNFAFERGFFPKAEFHITIIGFGDGRRISEKASDETRNKIEGFIKETDWRFELTGELYEINKNYTFKNTTEKRSSIIEAVFLPSLDEFILKLSNFFKVDFSQPFSHITLFVKGDKGEKSEGIGIYSLEEFSRLKPIKINLQNKENQPYKIKTIILPTRPQPDTIIAIFLLRQFGQGIFSDLEEAQIELRQVLAENKPETEWFKEGFLPIDIGGGSFDHHNRKPQITTSDLVSTYLEIQDNSAIQKLLEYARRDDFYGKGTLSTDSLDRAFGLSGLISSLNKSNQKNPEKVIASALPLIEAHYQEENRRNNEMPKEIEEIKSKGKFEDLKIKQRKNNLKVVILESENLSFSGYLRSQNGGRYDVVVQWLPSGHVNIMTRPTKRVDLRQLAALIRNAESMLKGNSYESNLNLLSKPGRWEKIPEWYFDDATNSIFNGGVNPEGVAATKISKQSLKEILKLGLAK